MTGHDLNPLKELVRQRCGLQFEAMAESNLDLAVQKRMAATQTEQISVYYTRVLGDEKEFDELVSLLTINETYFFREPRQLELLTNQLVPAFLAKGERLPLRILSAGCSTGEEPYSIAMAILDKYGESASQMVKILAGDIDQHALRRARQAHFDEYSFRGVRAEIRERYFTHVRGHGYRLDPKVRAMVEFHSLNLLAPVMPGLFVDFDIVFFRNVSIYFDMPARLSILKTLHATMRETGCLVLGTAETMANDLGVFHLVEKDGLFYFSKDEKLARQAAEPARQLFNTVPMAPKPLPRLDAAVKLASTPKVPAPPVTVVPPQTLVAGADIEAVRTLVRAGQNTSALERVMPLRTADPANADLRLLESYILLQLRRFAEAAKLAQQILDQDNWSVDAMMLLGFVAKYQEDQTAAIGHFKLAAYTRPDCWPAHYYLGNLWLESEPVKARREYRTALMQLETNPDPDGGLRLPLDLPVADIRFLCKRRSGDMTERSPNRGT